MTGPFAYEIDEREVTIDRSVDLFDELNSAFRLDVALPVIAPSDITVKPPNI